MLSSIFNDIRSIHHAVTALHRPLPGEHLYFEIEDPTGRLLPIPLKAITSWEALEFILADQFKGRNGARRVMQKRYILKEHSTGKGGRQRQEVGGRVSSQPKGGHEHDVHVCHDIQMS